PMSSFQTPGRYFKRHSTWLEQLQEPVTSSSRILTAHQLHWLAALPLSRAGHQRFWWTSSAETSFGSGHRRLTIFLLITPGMWMHQMWLRQLVSPYPLLFKFLIPLHCQTRINLPPLGKYNRLLYP